MKKVVLALGLVIAGTVVKAQSIGVQAGVIDANVMAKDAGETVPTKDLISWKAGLVFDFKLGKTFSFMPNLNVLVKGAKTESSTTATFGGITTSRNRTGKTKFTYLEVPLNFVYNSKGTAGGLFVGLGPSLSVGLSGKSTVTTTVTTNGATTTTTSEQNIKFDDKKDANDNDEHAKSLELGGNFLVGYKFRSGLFISANYNQGFTDVDLTDNASFKNYYFGLNLGFNLSK